MKLLSALAALLVASWAATSAAQSAAPAVRAPAPNGSAPKAQASGASSSAAQFGDGSVGQGTPTARPDAMKQVQRTAPPVSNANTGAAKIERKRPGAAGAPAGSTQGTSPR